MINFKDILCVIVIYKSVYKNSKTYKTFIDKVKGLNIYICDNSPNSQLCNDDNIVQYNYTSQNIGLSKSYNNACEYAQKHKYEWMLLLDQDSDFTNVNITDYVSAINDNPKVFLFAPSVKCENKFMSPINLKNIFPHLEKEKSNVGIQSLFNYSPINSGMCINVEAFIKCGGYDANVFLDYSDYIFIKRFRKIFKSFYLMDKTIYQNLSTINDNKEQTINRYKLFCLSINSINKENIYDRIYYSLLVIKRCVSIMFRKACIEPCIICFKYLAHKL